MYPDGPRLLNRSRISIDQGHVNARVIEEERKRQTNRPGAND